MCNEYARCNLSFDLQNVRMSKKQYYHTDIVFATYSFCPIMKGGAKEEPISCSISLVFGSSFMQVYSKLNPLGLLSLLTGVLPVP